MTQLCIIPLARLLQPPVYLGYSNSEQCSSVPGCLQEEMATRTKEAHVAAMV